MTDQAINAMPAAALQAYVGRTQALVGWAGMDDMPEYPGNMASLMVAHMPPK